MRTILLYGKRNTGVIALLYLKAKGYDVKVADDSDILVQSIANDLKCKIVYTDLELQTKTFDLFLCVHGTRIFEGDELVEGKMVNIHPCLYKYKGHNPIKRYILNEDETGSVESHYMVAEVDAGEVIHREDFATGKVKNYESFYNIAYPFYIKTIDKTLEKLGI